MMRADGRMLLLTGAGFAAWGAAFLLLYGSQALGCRLGWQDKTGFFGISLQRAVLATLFLVLLAGIGALTLRLSARLRRARAEGADLFLHRVSRDAGVAAFAATLLNFVWVFFLTTC